MKRETASSMPEPFSRFRSILDKDYLISSSALKANGRIAMPMPEYNLHDKSEESRRTINTLISVSRNDNLFATVPSLFYKTGIQVSGSRILGQSRMVLDEPVLVQVPPDNGSLHEILNDALFLTDIALFNCSLSCVYISSSPHDFSVAYGNISFLETLLGVSIEDAAQSWVKYVESSASSAEKKYLKNISKHFCMECR